MNEQPERSCADEISWCVENIERMSDRFENKVFPDFAVGGIQGWCNRIRKIAGAMSEPTGVKS